MPKSETLFTQPITASTPPSSDADQSSISVKKRVEDWFIRPLRNMSGEDVFACLIICFPIIEAVIRIELNISDKHDVKFSENSPALKWFAKFLNIPEAQAGSIWDCLRNGLLHRSMIKADTDYVLSAVKSGRVAEYKDNKIFLYVWELRDAVISLIEKHHKNIWRGTSSPLPRVYLI